MDQKAKIDCLWRRIVMVCMLIMKVCMLLVIIGEVTVVMVVDR